MAKTVAALARSAGSIVGLILVLRHAPHHDPRRAQKNLGPSGCSLVILRKDFMATARDDLASMLDYRQHAAKGSRLNTPPTFGIYVMGQTFKWILEQEGIAALGARNEAKAKIVYDAIDAGGGFYRPVAQPDSRSRTNITFRTPSAELDARFVKEALANDMSGLKGYRAVDGLRASMYNALPQAGCKALASFMGGLCSALGVSLRIRARGIPYKHNESRGLCIGFPP